MGLFTGGQGSINVALVANKYFSLALFQLVCQLLHIVIGISCGYSTIYKENIKL